MSLQFPQDQSVQLNYASFPFTTTYDIVNTWSKSTSNTNFIHNTSTNGKVGINTTAPQGALEVVGYNNSYKIKLGTTVSTGSTYGANRLYCNGPFRILTANYTDEISTFYRIDNYDDPITSTEYFSIRTTGVNITGDIYATGNAGIGVSPSAIYKLNVNGSINSTSLYQNGIQIDFSSYATNTNLTNNYYNKNTTDTLLNAKQALISTYSITGGTGGSLGFTSGTLTLAMPNNYTQNMSISNLITPTSFIYKGTELSTTLGNYSTTGNDTNYLKKTGGDMTGNINMNSTSVLNFGTRVEDFLIRLYGSDYGFGINGATLRYNAAVGASHRFYSGTTNTTTINSTGNITATSFSGDGGNITNVPYSTITGKPSTFPADMTNIYTKTEVNGLSTLTNFYNKTTSDGRYLQLSGGSMTGDLIINKTNANIQIGSINGNNWAIPSVDGYFSETASAGDMVLRSFNKLHLLSGGGASAITINTNNNVGIGITNPNYKLFVNGSFNATSIYNNGTLIDFSSYALINNYYDKTTSDGRYLQLSGGTLTGNIDCKSIALTGANAFAWEADIVDLSSKTNTYINFRNAGASSDWCYLRQIGGENAYKMALDFHDDGNDARFCIRNINSVASPDGVIEEFSVDSGNVTMTRKLIVGNLNTNPEVQLGPANGHNLGVATQNQAFSESAAIGDMVLRSINKLILQSGGGGHALMINTNNSISCSGNLTISKTSPILTIRTDGEGQSAILYLSTPLNSASALKTAIISEGIGSWSRSKLHFCLNNKGIPPDSGIGWNDPIYNATIADARMTILPDGNVGIGITTPDSKLHITTPDNTGITTNLLNFKNSSGYGIYATSTSIGNRGNTLDFLSRDYNLTGGANITNRNLLSLSPDGNIGIGTTGQSQKLYVNGTSYLNGNSIVKGVLNIHNGNPYATANYTLNNGSLIIGDTFLNYGGGTLWNGGNAAGFMMECLDNTEIVVHDSGNRLASLMYYEGAANKITIGRDMGWGAISSVNTNGNLSSSGYIYAGGTTSGIRINGNDYGNTFYQDANLINGNAANIGFTLRGTNSFNFNSLSTTGGGYTTILSMNTSGISIFNQLIYNYLFNNNGANHGTYQDFNNIDKFGFTFIQNSTNGPGTASQYYSWYLGLGNEYPFANSVNGYYGMQFAVGRSETYPKLSVRRKENGSWTSWEGLTAEKAVSLTSGNKTISGSLTIQGELINQYWKFTNQSDYCRLYNSAGTGYFNFAAATLYADTTLQVNSTAYIIGVLTMGSGIKFKTDVWNTSTDNINRVYYETNGSTYYQGTGPNDGSFIHLFRDNSGNNRLGIYRGGNLGIVVYGQITCSLYTTTSQNPHDYVGVPYETASGALGNYTLQLILNSFTAFHRNFTNDDLFDENDPQSFKDTYEGRIVISTGKIATQIGNEKDGYDIKYDKEGIFIEDSHPLIELSRKKKDKRVFGVLGRKDRKNSNEKRLIVNSVGEGGIWVCNSNGNIENGDYITSSDYLGYGEKQDEIYLCNYTVAKATMDCDFQLDSPLYQCIEIQEGLRIAFIGCTYHSG